MNRNSVYVIAGIGLMGICAGLLTTPWYFLAPALPLGIVGLLFLYRYPELGLLALAFLVPLEGLFAGNKLFTGAKFIGAALILIVGLKLLRKEIPLSEMKTPLWWPIALLVFAFVVSGVWSQYPELSNHSLRQLLTAISIFFITLGIKSRVNIDWLMMTVVTSVSITAFLALVSGEHSVEDRAIGLLTDPNYFALLLITAVPMCLHLLLQAPHRLLQLLWGGLLLLLLLTFQKTLSRSGVVVLVIVLAFMGYHYRAVFARLKGPQVGLIIIGGFMAMAALLVMMPESYRDRILSLANITSGVRSFDDRSMGRRTSYIVVGMDAFKENPIVGSGPGTFPVHYAKSGYATAFSVSSTEPELFRRAHNTYLETLTETGIVGFAGLCGIVLIGLRQFGRARSALLANHEWKHATVVAHMGAAFLAMILFFLFLTGLNNKYFWMMLALSSGFIQQARMSIAKETP